MKNCAAALASSTFTRRVRCGAADSLRPWARHLAARTRGVDATSRRSRNCSPRKACRRSGARCAAPCGTSGERDASTLTLSFSLGRGQFATAVLREICEVRGAAELDADRE